MKQTELTLVSIKLTSPAGEKHGTRLFETRRPVQHPSIQAESLHQKQNRRHIKRDVEAEPATLEKPAEK